MYIKRIQIKNIRSLSELDWKIDSDRAAGWHVIIGDNGAGKSAFVGSVAIALIGLDYRALKANWNDWLQKGQNEGQVRLDLVTDELFDPSPAAQVKSPNVSLERTNFALDLVNFRTGQPRHLVESGDIAKAATEIGWFSAAYGPFRRFSGGDPEDDKIYESNPRLARHLSVFSERFALTESLKWLQDLQFKKLEKRPVGNILASIENFINQDGFLPNRTHLEKITSDGVEFIDGNGAHVRIEELSDGYRSILSLTLELIRQLARAYGAERVFDEYDPTEVAVPGVVLIDEVDAHLHPTWQRRIGPWFCKHFPKMQFIVTTHSPFVCQAAEHGTVFKLPTPGTQEKGRMLAGIELERLLYGNILEAYSTEAFGSGSTRSATARKRTQRLAELNLKELREGLSEAEKTEQIQLRAMFPTTAHITEQEAAK